MNTKILTAAEMKAVDQNAVGLGMSPLQLMENAGSAVADAVCDAVPIHSLSTDSETVWFFAGLGNNGGDTFVAARRLADKNIRSIIFLLGTADKIKTEESAANYALLKKVSSIETVEITDTFELSAVLQSFSNPAVIVDGIFGTGFGGVPRILEKAAIEQINDFKTKSSDIFVLSVDVPSGVSVSGSDYSVHVSADSTITFHKMKSFLKDGAEPFGKVTVAPIGIPDAAEKIIGVGDLSMLFRRGKFSKKGDSGKVLVIAGGAYTGAPALAGMAVLRAGCDIVTVAAPKSVFKQISSFAPELIVKKMSGDVLLKEDVPHLIDLIQTHDSVILGPGFGTATESLAVAAELIPHLKKAVIDADALRPEIFKALESEAGSEHDFVLTPHYNEFLRLATYCNINLPPKRTDVSVAALEKAVAEISCQLKATILLKGSTDLISNGAADESRYNETGNAGMSVGGTGDVLAGLVGGLLSKNPAFESACCGAYICGLAGDSIYLEKGNSLIPSDILDAVPVVLSGTAQSETRLKNKCKPQFKNSKNSKTGEKFEKKSGRK